MRQADVERTALRGHTAAAVTWVWDACGYEGSSPEAAKTDQVQCPMCGEPVTPMSR